VNTADSVWAFELAHRAADIARRLGVEAIRFAPGPLAAAEPPPELRQTPVTSPDDLRAAAEIAASIGDENLRKSVEKAVSLSLARDRVDRPV
jgi:hypothetical protein